MTRTVVVPMMGQAQGPAPTLSLLDLKGTGGNGSPGGAPSSRTFPAVHWTVQFW